MIYTIYVYTSYMSLISYLFTFFERIFFDGLDEDEDEDNENIENNEPCNLVNGEEIMERGEVEYDNVYIPQIPTFRITRRQVCFC